MKMTREERWLEIIRRQVVDKERGSGQGVVRSGRDGKRWLEMVKSQKSGQEERTAGQCVWRGHQTEGRQPGILEMITEQRREVVSQ